MTALAVRCVVPIAAALALAVAGCQPRPDLERLREEILELHRAAIQAHLDQDVAFFTRDLGDQYFSVGGGEIRHPTRAEIESTFGAYLDRTAFSRYEDLQEPIVGLSDDGSLAWSIVRVRVEGVQESEDGSPRELGFTCAWITLYRRQDDRWIRLGEVSSFE